MRLRLIVLFVCSLALLFVFPSCSCEDPEDNQTTEEDVSHDDIDDQDVDPDADDPDADDPDPDADTPDAGDPDDPVSVLPGLDELNDDRLDLLWVLDNAGNMCRATRAFDETMEEFLDLLAAVDLDVNVAVTTTQMNDEYSLEPVARPGYLQSAHQPLSGFDAACSHPLDAEGDPIRSDVSPIRERLQTAVDCTADPSAWADLLDVSDHLLRCAVDVNYRTESCTAEEFQNIDHYFPPLGYCHPFEQECQGEPGVSCTSDDDCDSVYREIPLVLNTGEFRDGSDDFDRTAFAEEFRCMSQVGSRGYGFRQGLGAAVEAVSPELTGGPEAGAGDAPNAGFLRPDARLAVIFLASRNDCTHDGTLDETTNCAQDQCTIQENLGDDGALIAVDTLFHDFLLNFGRSQGWIPDDTTELSAEWEQALASTVVPVAFLGDHQIDADLAPEDCTVPGLEEDSCDNEYALAWSGHRFAQFAALFPASSPSGDLPDIGGGICGPPTDVFQSFQQVLTEL